jgi:hypothetical protein
MIIYVALMQLTKTSWRNADPSNESAWVESANISRRGNPIGLYNCNALYVNDNFDASARDADNYTIRIWLGLLRPFFRSS